MQGVKNAMKSGFPLLWRSLALPTCYSGSRENAARYRYGNYAQRTRRRHTTNAASTDNSVTTTHHGAATIRGEEICAALPA